MGCQFRHTLVVALVHSMHILRSLLALSETIPLLLTDFLWANSVFISCDSDLLRSLPLNMQCPATYTACNYYLCVVLVVICL